MAEEELKDPATGRPLPPNPPNEEERLKVSAAIFPDGGLGDGAPEDAMLHSMCKTICKLFNVPIAGKQADLSCSYVLQSLTRSRSFASLETTHDTPHLVFHSHLIIWLQHSYFLVCKHQMQP